MWVSDLPSVISAGTTVKWRDEATTVPFNQNATSTDWTLTYYLRTNINILQLTFFSCFLYLIPLVYNLVKFIF